MPLNKQNRLKVPTLKIDKKLNKLAEKNLFPDKVEMANRMLDAVELPPVTKIAVSSKTAPKRRPTSRVPA